MTSRDWPGTPTANAEQLRLLCTVRWAAVAAGPRCRIGDGSSWTESRSRYAFRSPDAWTPGRCRQECTCWTWSWMRLSNTSLCSIKTTNNKVLLLDWFLYQGPSSLIKAKKLAVGIHWTPAAESVSLNKFSFNPELSQSTSHLTIATSTESHLSYIITSERITTSLADLSLLGLVQWHYAVSVQWIHSVSKLPDFRRDFFT
jgi:hypothetical protein